MNSPDQMLLSAKQIAALLGIHPRTVARMAEDGSGPPRIRVSEKRVGYLRSDLEAWLASRRESKAR